MVQIIPGQREQLAKKLMPGSYLLEFFGLFIAHKEEGCLIGLTAWTFTTKEIGSVCCYISSHLCFCLSFHPHLLLPLSHTVTLRHSLPFLPVLSQVGRPSPKPPQPL